MNKALASEAIIKPISPIKNRLPNRVKSVFVTRPKTAITPKLTAVIPKVKAIVNMPSKNI
jgi:hypothetical protein